MKKIACLLTAAFMLLSAGCSQAVNEPVVTESESVPTEKTTAATNESAPTDDSVILPPTRIGDGSFSASLEKIYTFETGFSSADAVARIKVGNWLSENNGSYVTYYEATVLQCFKGDIPETFTLVQDGSSVCSMEGYPLFSYGNELLLFLYQSTTPGRETVFWIIGAFTTVLDVAYDADGTRYYADRYGILSETMDISSNYAQQDNISSEVYASAVNSDPFIAEIADNEHPFYSYIFSESDVNELINSCKES